MNTKKKRRIKLKMKKLMKKQIKPQKKMLKKKNQKIKILLIYQKRTLNIDLLK
jgi:hypothetical protein